jgi:hypothetical protein
MPKTPFRVVATNVRYLIILVVMVGSDTDSVGAQDTSVEGCTGCHSNNGVVPVGNINNRRDVHYVDLDPNGPATDSTYREHRAFDDQRSEGVTAAR